MKIVHYSCKPGIDLIPKKDQAELRSKLTEVFGSPSPATYYNKVNDYKNIPYHEKTAIDGIFSELGLAPEQVWKTWESDGDTDSDI